MALSFALAGGIGALREGRRRSSLNEAVHELRRPLQVLALSLPGDGAAATGLDSSLRLAVAAVDRLEREINGGGSAGENAALFPRPTIEAAMERWRGRADLTGRRLSLYWKAGEPFLLGDEIELGQALDNMISNAFEHGSGEVAVEVREGGGFLRVAVLDAGCAAVSAPKPAWGLRARIGGRDRHGHGLRIVRRIADRHGGSFRLQRSHESTEARLELPIAGGKR